MVAIRFRVVVCYVNVYVGEIFSGGFVVYAAFRRLVG